MYKYLISLFAISFLLTGCGFHGEMRYTGEFGGYVDKWFSKRLANCERYYSHAYYYGSGVFQIRRHTINIKGWDGNSCKIVVDNRGFLPPDGDKPETLLVPKRFTKEISDILLQAFKEPEYNEEIASEMALDFCRKNEISNCLIEHSVTKKPVLYKYLTPIAGFFKHYNPEIEPLYDELSEKIDKEKTICNEMIEEANTLVRTNRDFANVPDEKMKDYACSRIKMHKNCYFRKKTREIAVFRWTEYKGESFTSCRFNVNLNQKGVTDTYFWGANSYDIANRTQHKK